MKSAISFSIIQLISFNLGIFLTSFCSVFLLFHILAGDLSLSNNTSPLSYSKHWKLLLNLSLYQNWWAKPTCLPQHQKEEVKSIQLLPTGWFVWSGCLFCSRDLTNQNQALTQQNNEHVNNICRNTHLMSLCEWVQLFFHTCNFIIYIKSREQYWLWQMKSKQKGNNSNGKSHYPCNWLCFIGVCLCVCFWALCLPVCVFCAVCASFFCLLAVNVFLF